MRRLDKSYPYQQPSRNRSSKQLNQIVGRASVFPAYPAWGDEQLAKRAAQCKNPKNCFQEELDARKSRKAAKAKSAQLRKQQKEGGAQ